MRRSIPQVPAPVGLKQHSAIPAPWQTGRLMSRDSLISIGLGVSVLAAFFIFWLVGTYAEAEFGKSAFGSRFPETTLCYGVDRVRDLAASDVRKVYIVPLLFPLDLFVMMVLAGSMGAAIWYWLHLASPAWTMLALIPLIYLVFDLAEDCLLAWMLQHGAAWADWVVLALKTLTAIKFLSVGASMVVTVGAFLLLFCRAPSGNLG